MTFFLNLKEKLCLAIILCLIFNNLAAQIPVISSFSPVAGKAGTTVTVSGANFSAVPVNNTVYFGGIKSTVLTASATTLTVSVPYGAKFAPISVTTNNLTAYSSKFFNVVFTGAAPGFNSNSFSPRTDYSPGPASGEAVAVEAADFDGDGKIDIASANDNGASFTIYKNQTISDSIIFGAPLQFPTTGSTNVDIALADMDGDGKQDILIAGEANNSFSIYRNTSVPGTISFAAEANFPTGSTVSKISVRDLDNDGKPDVVLGDHSAFTNSLSVYRNTSSGASFSFATKVNLASSTVYDISLGDLDNDGKTDIAMVNLNSSNIYVFQNTSPLGGISFNAAQTFAAGLNTSSVALGDLNGDGKLDIAACNDQGFSVSGLRNTTTGSTISFAPKVDFSVSTSPFKVGIADVNGNGLPDIIVTEYNNKFSFGINSSTASGLNFAHSIGFALPGVSISIAVSDFNNDGKNDLAFGHTFIETGTLSVFNNKTTSPVFYPSVFSAAPGSTVTLTGGAYLNTTTSITVDGIAVSSFTVIDTANVSFVVPNGISQANVSIVLTTQYGTGVYNNFYISFPPQIAGFSPDSGYLGSVINIRGHFLNYVSSVSFGGVQASSFTIQNDSLITAVVSTGASGPVAVVSWLSGTSGSLNGFRFIGPTITSFTPTSANIGDTVIIHGSRFIPTASVSFGGTAASSFTVLNDSTIKAVVGLGDSGALGVTTNRGAATLNGFIYTGPIIISFTPALTGKGRQVTITGKNFTGATAVKFGGTNAASFTINSATSITAIVDTGSTGSVTVTTSYGTTSKSGFTFARVPQINSFTPGAGGPGITILIKGKYFTGVSFVSFGGVSASNFYAASDTVINAVINTGASGNIIVTTSGGQDTIAGFVFVPTPTITSFTPDIAGTGTVDTITGTRLLNTSSVSFGGIAATSFTVLSDSVVVAVVGAGATGYVSLTTPGGIASQGWFYYMPPPTIDTFSPSSGSTNHPVIIRGTNFTDVTGVSFGGAAAASFTINSDTEISALIGNGASGNVTVTTSYGTASKPGFAFIQPLAVTSFSPATAKQGETITIRGSMFNSGVNSVTLGGTRTNFFLISDSVITAIVGSGSSGAVSVSNFYQTASLGGFTFIYPPLITSFAPDSGAAGTIIIITGQNFSTLPASNIVYFGTARATVTSASSTSLSVVVPTGAAYAPITVTANGLMGSSYRAFTKTFSTAALLNGSFGDRLDLPTGTSPESIAIGDLDGDGKQDVAVANYDAFSISIYRNISSVDSIKFAPRIDLPAGRGPHNITISDLNGDGKQELVYLNIDEVTYRELGLAMMKNTSSPGNISFDTIIRYIVPNRVGNLAIIDADSDGRPDIYVSAAYRNGGTVGSMSYFRNNTLNGSLSFGYTPYYFSSADYLILSLAAGDYNNDNQPDLAIGTDGTTLPILLGRNIGGLVNYGSGFSHQYNHLSAADLDKDGKTDIVTGQNFYQNLTASQSSSVVFIPAYFSAWGYSTVDDMDGDGKPDVIKSADSSNVIISKNTSVPGTISFAPDIKYPSLQSPYALVTGDLDGDSKPEIIAANYSGNSISILKNKVGSLLQLCPPAANTTITTNLSGTIYQWQMNSGSGYVNISNGTNFSNTNTATLSLNNIPSAWYGRKFRCLTNGNTGYVYTIQFADSWTGAADSSWENPLNWSCGTIPDINTDVKIKSGNIIVNSNASIRSLLINPVVALTISSGYNLTIAH